MNEHDRRGQGNSGDSGFAPLLGWLLALMFVGMVVFGVGKAVLDAYGH